MSWYRGRAALVQDERRIPLSDCSVEVVPARPDALGEWWGEFELEETFDLLEPGDFTLELEDGRKGEVFIRRMLVGTGLGEFRGTGPPPS